MDRSRLAALAAVVLMSVALAGAAPLPAWQSPLGRDHALTGTIWDVAAGRAITPDELVRKLAARRYVLLGEKHDNPDHHRLQAWIVSALVGAGRRPAVAFEMFRADQAAAIARHLAAHPRDAAGLAVAVDWEHSGWPPWSMYEPIAEAALAAGLPIVAANLAEAVTTTLRRGGVAALDPALVTRLGLDTPLPETVHAALAVEIREGHCGQLPEAAVDGLVAGQRARDAQLGLALREAGGDGAVLIAGGGHVRRDLGVPRVLPAADSAAVGFLEVQRDSTTAPSASSPFDYVWFTPRMDDVDPCERFRPQLDRLRDSHR